MEITCFIHRFWVFSPRKYCFGSSFQIYGCLCGCSCWMLWERKKLWLCKISPAMASLLQSISITLILIPNRHAIPFIVLYGLQFTVSLCVWNLSIWVCLFLFGCFFGD
ncbi:hypothetical protein E1A91_D12G314300v1 [Gossypium mustelinum]|uniref:Uncharacterized protein n=1 Tax=Gossypium mustelinum TaxID=34275 RepID=A0A5D2SKA2_GOSMU|nr:hypothetical protein E1A91_D12G314300v1 [Gossypium mustelinum]TYI53378.1 hypothetical protein E1A91_D12G314300v1 [Gossypium mustelinum]